MRIIGEVVKEDFTVVDSFLAPVLGLEDGEFIEKLYNPSNTEVSGSIFVTVTELGSGNYRASFTPNVSGDWYLVIFHPTYFSWGKGNTIEVSQFGEKLLKNKKTLTKVSDTQYTEKWYDDDDATVIKEFNITEAGNVETRDPV